MTTLILFVAAFVGGALNSLAGGGTLVTFPALLFVGLSSIDANASSVVALFPGTFAGAWGYRRSIGPVAKLVGIEGGVVSGVINLESAGVRAPARRPRHEEHYHEV
jgi:uncharacterized membrane protein YfcA